MEYPADPRSALVLDEMDMKTIQISREITAFAMWLFYSREITFKHLELQC